MPRRALQLALGLLALALLALPAAPRPASASPGPAQAPAITILSPNSSTIANDSLFIQARVTSTIEIASVVAAVGTLTTTLTCCNQNDAYTGRIGLSGLPRGQYMVTVTATDALGGTSQAQAGFILDRPPTLSVDAPPAASILYDNRLDVRFSCADDNPAGCQRVTVLNQCNGLIRTLASGTTAISQTINVGQTGGAFGFADICLQGTDSAGQRTATIPRRVYYNLPPYLVRELDTPGKIIDADATRVLVQRADPPSLAIVDRATRAETTIAGTFVTARLVPDGLLYVRQRSTLRLYQWRDGTTTDLGPITLASLAIEGNYAAWAYGTLYRRDLAAGITVVVATNAREAPVLLPSGDLIHATIDNKIVRYSGGASTTLIEGGDFLRLNPAGDGTTLIYTRCVGNLDNCTLVELKDGQEVPLLPQGDFTPSYRVTNGWVAYTKPGNAGANQIWRRAPDGTEERISFLNQLNTIDQLGPDGSLIWNERRFLSRPGQPPLTLPFDPTLPAGVYETPTRFFNRGEIWEMALEGSLFSVEGIFTEQLSLPALAR